VCVLAGALANGQSTVVQILSRHTAGCCKKRKGIRKKRLPLEGCVKEGRGFELQRPSSYDDDGDDDEAS